MTKCVKIGVQKLTDIRRLLIHKGMGKPDITTITAFECRSILDSIQNEYEQRQKEDSILSKLQEDLADLIAQRNILAKRKEFNEKYCVLCCSAFNLLFKRKVFCQDCNFWICRSCSLWDNSSKHWLCKVCEKQKLLDAESRAWICNRVKASFGNFGAAKALHSFCRSRRISDSENDSGYGTAGDFIPLMKLLSSHSLNKELKMSEISHDEDCEDDDDDVGDEEELAEIHHSIETILEGLLGGTLDDASVDYLYPNSCLYINLFSAYHVRLVEVIQNLSKALQKALHNLPSENGITPTTAHAALKNVIAALVEECQDLPPLQVSEQGECESNIISNVDFAEIFSSYDSLVAAAVINKIVEESQSKFKASVYNSLEENPKIEENEKVYRQSTEHISEEAFENIVSSATGFNLPVECVQIEEIEEITQEFTDSEDDKLSSISKWSNSLQSVEEVGIQKHPDIDPFLGMDPSNDVPTPFPEFGCDLVDDPENKDCGITCHSTAVTSWEDNWLFRKKKRLPLYSNLKYQLLTYCDEPPCMLIPCPTETTDNVESDEFSSELSETHSAGSLEFSSDPDDLKLENENFELSSKLYNEATSKSLTPAVIDPSPDTEISELPDVQFLESQLNVECQVNESKSEKIVNLGNAVASKELGTEHEPSLPCEEEHLSHPCEEKQAESYSPLVENVCISTPPRPGTIAEREHKKWLNAIPLKNNPYSAENISKRLSYSKKAILKEPISSFEEFERKLSVSSETSESAMNKLNCGPKSIDSELYKRDYYVNKDYEIQGGNIYPVKKSKSMCSINDDGFDALSEEALNSFEEKVYISSGKVFTLENHVKRLERELKDLSPSSEMPSVQSFLSKTPLQLDEQRRNEISINNANPTSDEESLPLPSVKCLATKFSPNGKQVILEEKSVVTEDKVSNKTEEKLKKSRPCMKVHSLTARSLSREFRDLAKQNLPKPMNRTIQVPSHSCDEGTSERESLCSPESVQSSFSAAHTDIGHGYTSDESNTSTNSIPRSKVRRHISRSILQRASYWERRAEQGLLSDASVSEEFPGIDINPE